MELQQDLQALFELARSVGGRWREEQLRTLVAHKEQSFRGAVYLFLSSEKNGVKHYEVARAEKNAKTGYWDVQYPYITFTSIAETIGGAPGSHNPNSDPEYDQLDRAIHRWRNKGEL